MSTPMPPLGPGDARAPRRRGRRRHAVAVLAGLLPSVPLLLWLALVAITEAVDRSSAPQPGAVGQVLGWTLLVLPVTLVLGLPLVGLVYLVAGLRDSRTRRRAPAVAR
ncbi:hypothetical protein [Janibacter melonis]|uniref:hypothetical protein n=1 Tax=Janibacter melonis TaxID=262209 RepID=UPI0020961A69|nr:hypothetical protein [Janibacter melonis]